MSKTIAYSGPRITPEQVAEGVLQTGIEPLPDEFCSTWRQGHRCACGLGIALAAKFDVQTLDRVGKEADDSGDPTYVYEKLDLDGNYGAAFVHGFDNPVGDPPDACRSPEMRAGWLDGVASRIAADAAWAQMQAAKTTTKGTL